MLRLLGFQDSSKSALGCVTAFFLLLAMDSYDLHVINGALQFVEDELQCMPSLVCRGRVTLSSCFMIGAVYCIQRVLAVLRSVF
jgi:succinate dehydrogenase hydrophobic anchor subunit